MHQPRFREMDVQTGLSLAGRQGGSPDEGFQQDGECKIIQISSHICCNGGIFKYVYRLSENADPGMPPDDYEAQYDSDVGQENQPQEPGLGATTAADTNPFSHQGALRVEPRPRRAQGGLLREQEANKRKSLAGNGGEGSSWLRFEPP